MKRSTLNGAAASPNEAIASLPKNNGKSKSHDESLDLNVILAALQRMRNGDFSVRLDLSELDFSYLGKSGSKPCSIMAA